MSLYRKGTGSTMARFLAKSHRRTPESLKNVFVALAGRTNNILMRYSFKAEWYKDKHCTQKNG